VSANYVGINCKITTNIGGQGDGTSTKKDNINGSRAESLALRSTRKFTKRRWYGRWSNKRPYRGNHKYEIEAPKEQSEKRTFELWAKRALFSKAVRMRAKRTPFSGKRRTRSMSSLLTWSTIE